MASPDRAQPVLLEVPYVCAGTTSDGNPCLNFVTEKGEVCGLCSGVATDRFGTPLGRGGYPRNGNGAAVVTSPDGELYKSGAKKGQIKMLAYKSASGVVVSVSEEGLSVWKQTQLLRALARDPELAGRFLKAMAAVDPKDLDAEAKVLTKFREEAHEIADTQLAAQRGTFAHWLTECADNGISPLDGIAKGGALGIDDDTAQRIMEQWTAINVEFGFESVLVEAKIVNDDLKAAGTTDRVVRLTRPLTFDHRGLTVTLPEGTVLISDLKTGKLRTTKDGNPQYWQKYTGQIAAYAGGHLYDPRMGERLSWDLVGGRPSQEWGVIVHADLSTVASGGSGGFSIFMVDLVAGRRLAAVSNELRAAESSANKAISPAHADMTAAA